MTSYRLMDGLSGRPGVGSSGTQPPSSPASFTGTILIGLPFIVNEGGLWFEGYWWWVPATNGSVTAQKFCLWQVMGNGAGFFGVVPGSVVTSGTLTAGQWNFVPLSEPVNLSPSFWYVAETGMSTTAPSGFPDTQNQFATAQPYAAGITNGPLSTLGATGWPAWISGNGSPGAGGNMRFALGSSDPTSAPTINVSSNNDLLWIDVQVSDQAPTGASYSGFPSLPGGYVGSGQTQVQEGVYTLGLEFNLTEACQLSRIRFFSPPGSGGAAALPTWCGVWDVTSQTVVAGTANSSPAWISETTGLAATAGGGWIYCDYSSLHINLNAGQNYKVSTFGDFPSTVWFSANGTVFGTGGFLTSGITNGPLVIPGSATATPGQDSWNTAATPSYPNTTNTGGKYDGIDVLVTPSGLTGTGGLVLPARRLSGSGNELAPISGSGGITLPARRLSGSQNIGSVTSRWLVRNGIAAYLGGSWVENIRAYQDGPLLPYGVGTVRAGWGKRMNMQDFFNGMPAGRSMGCYVIVDINHQQQIRRAMGGPPVTDGSGSITSGGIEQINYRVTLHCFHLAQVGYSEDASEDVDKLIEAIEQQLRIDRTLGMPGTIIDAGQTPYGVQVEGPGAPDERGERVGHYFRVSFEVRVQIVA